MIRAWQLSECFEGESLYYQIEEFCERKKITRDNLIDIKYAVNESGIETFKYALVIYDDGQGQEKSA